jgi:NADPH:quinone reductase-like Zn-dependent oxidoreductase
VKAIVQDRYGGAETLELADVEQPSIADDQVLVQVRAAGVGRGALHLIRGRPLLMRALGFGLRRPKARVPGTNISGRVEAVGAAVRAFAPGDDVYGTCTGAFADFAAADEDRLAPKPRTLSFDEAAVLPYAGVVALQALRDRARVERGQTVLVVGASGAVGTVVVQLAVAYGCEVSGVCGSGNATLVRRLGAVHTIDHTLDDFTQRPERYDVVIDVGGNTPVRRLRRVLTRSGALVIIGGEGGGPFLGGAHRQVTAQLLSPFVSQSLGALIASEDTDTLRALNEFVDAGALRPVMGRTLPLVDAPDAIDDLEHRRTRGRLALVP